MREAGSVTPSRQVPHVMLVTDRRLAQVPLPDLIQQAVAGGVDGVQLREKDLTPAQLEELAANLRNGLPDHVPLLVNSDIHLASRLGIGVHLPEKGPPVCEARDAVGPRELVGRSVHSPREAAKSTGADYLLAGNIFETNSKPGREGIGLDGLRRIVEAAPAPVIAIGGIDPRNASSVLEAGAYGVAVISAIATSRCPTTTAQLLCAAVKRSKAPLMNQRKPEPTLILVNGKEERVSQETTVAGFLASKGFQDRLVVVESNGWILSRDDFASTTLQPNDRLEIVHFVGGG